MKAFGFQPYESDGHLLFVNNVGRTLIKVPCVLLVKKWTYDYHEDINPVLKQ